MVDRLVGDYGVGYFKLDYNINPGAGTDQRRDSAPAHGLLDHNRAHLDWLDGVLDRHPDLMLENCASGAHADGLRHAVPAAAAVDQRPAGPAPLPADRGRRAAAAIAARAGRQLGLPAAGHARTRRSRSR